MMAIGAVSPDVQGRMEAALEGLRVLEEQMINDIILLGRQGASEGVLAKLQAARNAFGAELVTLEAAMITADDASADAWFAGAQHLEASGLALLKSLGQKRSRAVEMQRFMGLGWGLGTAVVAAGLGWWVWRRRGGKRRRRR